MFQNKSMTRRTVFSVLRPAVLIPLILLLGVACSDENVDKGKQFMQIGDFEAAKKEFKIALSNNADNNEAKIWFMTAEGLGNPKKLAKALDSVPELELLLNENFVAELSAEDQNAPEEAFRLIRRELYDKGIETARSTEIVDLFLGIAKIIFDMKNSDVDHQLRNAAAFVLAWKGESSALTHLLDSLQGSDDQGNAERIVRLGEKAADAVEEVVSDKNHLARTPAVRILTRLRVKQAAGIVFERYKNIGTEDSERLDAAFNSRTAKSVLEKGKAGLTPSAVRWVSSTPSDLKHRQLRPLMEALDETDEKFLLVLNGMTPDGGFHSVPFIIDNGKLSELTIERGSQKSDSFRGYAPILNLKYVKEGSYVAIYAPGTEAGAPTIRLMKGKLSNDIMKIDPSMDMYASTLNSLMGSGVRPIDKSAAAAETKRLEELATKLEEFKKSPPPQPAITPSVAPSTESPRPAAEAVQSPEPVAITGRAPIVKYRAKLSSKDHANRKGKLLTQGYMVIRQDRANVHKYKIRDPEDQLDHYFLSKDKRSEMESLLKSSLTKEMEQRILNGTPVVDVTIWESHAEITIL